ncbi:GFA family protein [Oceanicoccus sagamiensis]|uniref:Aldehyde-activating protein n=1 Tax=Oceanicoccus sagamiensis TaxID=716816 RepID=A0A1X9NG87_9GAMM|nr:GFA family protein [Oceanicoccus sagamiensis]ARN76181.1 aldehyde-activating protein [Oceanicoccus sagamiensis]
MEHQSVGGSCLCGKARYQITGNLGIFQYCHCSRCQKFTGSAHASNLFVGPEQFSWLAGEEFVGRFEPADTRYFATAFCQQCGSSMPWLSKSGKALIIPAGTLDDDPGINPFQNIFYGSRACWYQEVGEMPLHDTMPPRKKPE